MLVYASLTGNTREGAEIIEDKFLELGADIDVMESYDADPFDFEAYDICIVGTYTYGTEGELPDEIIDFYEELEDVDLEGKVYGVFGSGDTFYVGLYGKSVDDFEVQFEKTKAVKGADVVKYELDPDDEAIEMLKKFAEDLFEQVK
jgi:flavodoxin short chain